MNSAIKRIREMSIEFNSVIDVGASDGRWSVYCNKYFPSANYILIEAQKEHEEKLKVVKGKLKNFNYLITAAGDYKGEIFFDASDLFGGVASKEELNIDKCAKLPVNTVDNIVTDLNAQAPYLLKLDTHGFEVPIFDGADNTLKNTNVIVIEVYNFNLTKSSLRFHEMINYLENKGFRCIDIVDVIRRKKDNILWQMDMIFIKKESNEFKFDSYE
jgi:FkbM family methyltransferase